MIPPPHGRRKKKREKRKIGEKAVDGYNFVADGVVSGYNAVVDFFSGIGSWF